MGPAILRFGGNSVEDTYWSPTGTPSCSYTHTVVAPSLIDDVFALAKKLHWKVIWGEGVEVIVCLTAMEEGGQVSPPRLVLTDRR